MKVLKLTNGEITKLDDDDFEYFSRWQWHWCGRPNERYVVRWRDDKKGKIYLHVEIAKRAFSFKEKVDHIDGNRLNNQKENLRPASKAQNSMNRGPQSNSTTGYKGVYYSKQTMKYQAKINYYGICRHLGFFTDLEEAARAYDKAAKIFHGQFAYQNLSN